MGEFLAASGFVTFTFNHRFYDAPHLEAAQADVEAALQKVRSGLWELDPERGAVFCYSGGGVFLSQLLEKPPAFLRGLVGYYPCLDIRDVPPGQRDLLGPDIRKRFSSVLSVHSGSPAMLLARAGLDQPALNRTIDLFVETALQKNAPLDFLNHSAGRHGFEVLDVVPRSREILERTRVFLAACLS
jgi:acetyl esterase/lipase